MIRQLIFTLVVLVLAEPGFAQDEPVPTELAVTADACRELLQRSIIDFYLPESLDTENGGFHEALDVEGRFISGEKFLTLQARQVWFFSHLAVNNIRRMECADAAAHGYEFLADHFRDDERGGYVLKTGVSGATVDGRKHIYTMAFVIYALVELHRINADQEPPDQDLPGKDPPGQTPLDQAMQLFREFDEHCYDQENGGYQELFTNDWQPINDPEQWGVVSTAGTKTYNSHLHILEAFTELYRETKDELVGRRLSELISINTTTLRHPDFACNIDGWTPQWKMIEGPENLRASYGHDLECVWLVLEANDALGRSSALLKNWAVTMCANSIKFGNDATHGGFYSGGIPGAAADDLSKVWWVQSEAMIAMLTMERLTGDEKYRQLFESTFRFVEKHHVAEQGGWWANLNEDGSVDGDMRANMWKGAYHDGRALVRCERMLRELDAANER